MTGNHDYARAAVGLSVLSLLVASFVAMTLLGRFWGGVFCVSQQVHGANIEHGLVVAFLGGLVWSLAILCVRRWRRQLAVVLLLEAATLGVAIAFVELDSATYQAHRDCGLLSSEITDFDEHVEYLYALWGLPLGFLVWAAVTPWVKPRLARRAFPSLSRVDV